jgi:MFS family permease
MQASSAHQHQRRSPDDCFNGAVERGSLRWLFVLVSALVLSEVMFYSVLAPLLPYYSRHLHLSKSAAGLLSASYAIGTLIFAVPLGILVARVGAKRATVCSAFLLACASIGFGLSHSVMALDTARFAQGVAGAGTWVGSLTWLLGSAPAHRRGETVGAVLGIGIGGALLGPVIGSAAELSEPRLVFGAVALLILALAALALATPGPIEVEGTLARGALRAVVRDRRLLGGMWFTALPAALFGVLNVLAPLRLSELGAGTVAVGAVFLMSAAIEAAASPLFGRISDRRGPLPLIRVGLACSALLAVLLPLPGSMLLVASATAIAGVTFGVAWVPASALLSAGAEEQGLHPGLAYALWNFAWAIGLTFGSAVGAPLAQVTDDAVPYGLLAALCAGTLVVIRHRRGNRLALHRTR